jgi:hypothetical protein
MANGRIIDFQKSLFVVSISRIEKFSSLFNLVFLILSRMEGRIPLMILEGEDLVR